MDRLFNYLLTKLDSDEIDLILKGPENLTLVIANRTIKNLKRRNFRFRMRDK